MKEALDNQSPPKQEEKKSSYHLDLLNKLAGEGLKSNKQKKVPFLYSPPSKKC
jgi:hypothetical protein